MFDARLIKNIASMAAFQAANFIVPLINFPYLTRVLGPEAFGYYGLAFAISSYLFLVVDWGFGWSASGAIARAGSDRAETRVIFWNTLSAKAIILVVVYLALSVAALSGFVPQKLLTVLICSSAITFGNVLSLDWYLQGKEELSRFVWPALGCRFGTVPLTFLLVKGPHDVWLAAAIQAAAGIAAGILSLFMVASRREVDRPHAGDLKPFPYIARGWPFFAAAAAPTLYTTMNTILLGIMAGPVVVASFAVADRLRSAAQSVLAPISKAAYPRSVKLTHENSPSLKRYLIHIFILEFVVAGGIASFLFIFNHAIMNVVSGGKFKSSADVLAVLAFAPPLVGLSDVIGMQIMLPRKLNRQFARIRWCAGGVNIALVAILIPRYMAVGAAIGTVAAEFSILVMMIASVRVSASKENEPQIAV